MDDNTHMEPASNGMRWTHARRGIGAQVVMIDSDQWIMLGDPDPRVGGGSVRMACSVGKDYALIHTQADLLRRLMEEGWEHVGVSDEDCYSAPTVLPNFLAHSAPMAETLTRQR